MAWQLEFNTTDPRGRRVEYWTLDQGGWSRAERPDKVTVSGKTVHRGWVSDHQGYSVYRQYVEGERK